MRRYSSEIELPTESSIRKEGLTNVFIDCVLFGRAKNYAGCFCDDTIPMVLHLQDSFVLVCNLSKSYERGSHFVTIAKSRKFMYYIDSFGRGPPFWSDGIRAFMHASSVPVFFNQRQLQHSRSTYCGFFAILFAFLYSNDREGEPFLHERDFPYFEPNDLKKNDILCLKHICQFTKKPFLETHL